MYFRCLLVRFCEAAVLIRGRAVVDKCVCKPSKERGLDGSVVEVTAIEEEG